MDAFCGPERSSGPESTPTGDSLRCDQVSESIHALWQDIDYDLQSSL